MKIEDLLDCSSEELKAMTDEELLRHFESSLKVTRPEFAVKPHVPTGRPTSIASSKAFAAKVELLKGLGVDIDLSSLKRKKK